VPSPWRRLPELQRQVFAQDGGGGDDPAVVAELRRLQESLNALRSGPSAGAAEATTPSPPSPASTPGRGRRRVAIGGVLVVAVAAGGLLAVRMDRTGSAAPAVGLAVFDRPQTPADTATYTGYIDSIVPESVRLLAEQDGRIYHGAKTAYGEICLVSDVRGDGMREVGGDARFDCVSESEFVADGIHDEILLPEPSAGELMADVTDSDVLRVGWTVDSAVTTSVLEGGG
jgi:hypothetical protein